MRPKVLLVEDSTSLAVLYKQYVKDEPYDLFHVETGKEAIAFIERNVPDLIILDLKLPDMSGEDILDWIGENQIQTSAVIATAHGSVDIAVGLIQKGAKDFLEKPIKADRLKTSISLHLKQAKLEHLVEDIEARFDRNRFHGFLGGCLSMQAVYKIIDSVAPTTASVFIHGESGTGKEVCAEAIHKESQRSKMPFVAINCGAIPKDLMESEVFGHVKGAFTGATSDRKGAASMADGGTLFLDELCEMDLDMQKKLLRFLQTGTFTPLGATKEVKVNVRILCATNRDPLLEVEEGRFREDLYYRVHVVPIEMPPLRERENDIVILANHFLKIYAKEDRKKFTGINKDAELLLKKYQWPGNVRQLQNIIRNIVVLNDEAKLSVAHLPAQILATKQLATKQTAKHVPNHTHKDASSPSHERRTEEVALVSAPSPAQDALMASHDSQESTASKASTIRPMWQIERETIQNAIDYCDGNVLSAAVLLELSPSTVYRKKQAWESDDEHSTA
ncbi:sigma-54-dependent Fis family transcriptional regulator [Vibrio genomosp. F10 str. ZF-129]|uniref:Sigma-54-dependent Fis family transcriptional regulator n=1 Tax=Vibrio genomosp. F10 str. ZF-129 TaxID=1187848 RepID=A0A1E5BFG0_9VIBR|nr:sigma-54 dependent transcriptional regulator [Vibrio genomosp. F10]OEE34546.1 sigma-54-dependent Fis family transcriptional regulator [Vibrio genomosp. F10 str. ZF-129]